MAAAEAAVAAAKRALRTDMRRLLAALSPEEKQRQSAAVVEQVLARPEYRRCRRLALYLALPDEVDPRPLLEHALASGRACFVPRFQAGSPLMEMVRVRDLADADALPAGPFGVRQPAAADARETPPALDLVLVPGLAFSPAGGGRLGRGKGYYDLFLARCRAQQRPPPVAVGLAFRQQLRDSLPLLPHDQRLDGVLAPPPAPAA